MLFNRKNIETMINIISMKRTIEYKLSLIKLSMFHPFNYEILQILTVFY